MPSATAATRWPLRDISPGIGELIREQQADALVLDLTGFDMSESIFDAVRRDPNLAELPIVIIMGIDTS